MEGFPRHQRDGEDLPLLSASAEMLHRGRDRLRKDKQITKESITQASGAKASTGMKGEIGGTSLGQEKRHLLP